MIKRTVNRRRAQGRTLPALGLAVLLVAGLFSVSTAAVANPADASTRAARYETTPPPQARTVQTTKAAQRLERQARQVARKLVRARAQAKRLCKPARVKASTKKARQCRKVRAKVQRLTRTERQIAARRPRPPSSIRPPASKPTKPPVAPPVAPPVTPPVTNPKPDSGTTPETAMPIGISYGAVPLTPAQRAAAFTDARDLGATWIRIDVAWSWLEGDQEGHFYWNEFDPIVADAKKYGLKILGVIDYSPRWAARPGCTGGHTCPPADQAKFARFAATVADRYRGTMDTFEIWNEQNLAFGWWGGINPEEYGQLLKRTTDAILATNPSARVMLGGLGYSENVNGHMQPADFLRRACAGGNCARLFAIGYHPYTYPFHISKPTSWTNPWERMFVDSPSPTAPQGQASMRTVLRELGLGHLPIWITEFGAPTGGVGPVTDGHVDINNWPDHVTERLQAELMADGVTHAAKTDKIGGLFLYTDRDTGRHDSPVDYFGLRRADGTKKPAFDAVRQAVASLR